MIWQMTYTHKMPKLCSATLNYHAVLDTEISYGFEDGGSWKNLECSSPLTIYFLSPLYVPTINSQEPVTTAS